MISSLLRERLILTDHCCKQEILTYRYAVIEFEPTETMNKPKTIKNETGDDLSDINACNSSLELFGYKV